jgi:serine O-acetyltransferase
MADIPRLTEELLRSYRDIGGINHIHGPNLPSRLGVETIISDLESLIFPGFKAEEPLDSENLQYSIAEAVNRLGRNLSNEITRSLCFKRRVEGDRNCISHGENEAVSRCRNDSEREAGFILEQIPRIRAMVQKDVEAAFRGDPASRSHEEVILSYPGVEAIMIHRVAHELWLREIPLIPRMMSEVIHGKTGIDIHPGASIGEYFFIGG